MLSPLTVALLALNPSYYYSATGGGNERTDGDSAAVVGSSRRRASDEERGEGVQKPPLTESHTERLPRRSEQQDGQRSTVV